MAAPRRERDETRVFKRMGDALGRATDKVETYAARNQSGKDLSSHIEDAEIIDDPRVYVKNRL